MSLIDGRMQDAFLHTAILSIEEDGNPPFGGFMASVSLCSEW